MVATNKNDTDKINFYLKRIQELGGSIKSPDGKACTITGTVSPSSSDAKEMVKK